MTNLFKMEVLRHRNWIAIFAAAHFLALYYEFSLGSSFTNGVPASGWLVFIMISATLFGVLQMKLHKRGNDWVYLLHRPLPQSRIHLALTLAGSALLGIALVVPALLMLVVMQIDGRLGTEFRHYQMPVFGAALIITAYSLGQFVVLGASRLSFFAVVLLLPFIFAPLQYSERVFTSSMLMLWTLTAAHLSFKPDLTRLQETMPRLLPTELPVMFGCYTVLVLLVLRTIMASSGQESIFRNNDIGTFNRITALSGSEQLLFALQHSAHPDTDFLAQQAMLAEVVPIIPVSQTHYPQRHQLPLNDTAFSLSDPAANEYWLFSHSLMLYEGLDTTTGTHIGWLGPDGFYTVGSGIPSIRFASVPLATTNEYLIVDDRLYQIDWEEKAIHLRYTNTAHEAFTDSLFVAEHFASIFSARQLFIFEAQDFRDPDAMLAPRAILNISSRVEGRAFAGFHVMELINGYLVLAVVDAPPRNNLVEFVVEGRARLQVWRAIPGSEPELITSVTLASDLREFLQFADFVAAPGIRVLADAFWGFKAGKSAERTFPIVHTYFPAWVILAALLVCIFSAAIPGWLLRKSKLPARIRRSWVIVCAVTGFAGLLAFLVGYYWRGRELLKLPLTVQTAKSEEARI